jgi:hypothetical protein
MHRQISINVRIYFSKIHIKFFYFELEKYNSKLYECLDLIEKIISFIFNF